MTEDVAVQKALDELSVSDATHLDGPQTKRPAEQPTEAKPLRKEKSRAPSGVSARKRRTKKRMKRPQSSVGKSQPASSKTGDGNAAKFPRHSVEKALRIPRGIVDQNAGQDCSDREAAVFAGVGFGGPFKVELSSAIKYGFLERPKPGHVRVSSRARQVLRPQKPGDEIDALRHAILAAPDVSAVYKHYRGENLPDGKFFENALVDKFGIPLGKVVEFTGIFLASLKAANLIEQRGDKQRVLDVTEGAERAGKSPESLKQISQGVKIDATDTCFVVMPFLGQIGSYYQHIYEPAIRKAGLRSIRADADIFGTGKIIDQIWSGIKAAKVLVAELTTRNPNVFYELGLAHALHKPVVLISSNSDDVPFDLKHIRVIYYDVNDPFWGEKLIDKVAENILSALKNPEEAVFERALSAT